MKTLKICGLFLATSLVVLSSCKKDKDDDNKPAAQTKTQLITRAGGWKTTSLTLNGVDIFKVFTEECEQDDITKFTTDGKATITEGAKACPEPTNESITWKFINNESQIVIDGDTTSITELTSTTLKLSGTENGVPAVITYTAQ